jgi:hypothetical protein
MKKILVIISILIGAVLVFSFLSFFIYKYKFSKPRQDLNTIIGGVLEADQVDTELFKNTIQSLVSGDNKDFQNNLASLETLITKKEVNDVVIKGQKSDSPYRSLYLFDANDMRWALANIDKVKSAGIDTLMIQASFYTDENQNPVVFGENVYLFYINAFQKSGFRIWLLLGPQQYYCNLPLGRNCPKARG